MSLFSFQCLGGDVVFDQLGLHVEDEAPLDNLGPIAALIVVNIIEGRYVYTITPAHH